MFPYPATSEGSGAADGSVASDHGGNLQSPSLPPPSVVAAFWASVVGPPEKISALSEPAQIEPIDDRTDGSMEKGEGDACQRETGADIANSNEERGGPEQKEGVEADEDEEGVEAGEDEDGVKADEDEERPCKRRRTNAGARDDRQEVTTSVDDLCRLCQEILEEVKNIRASAGSSTGGCDTKAKDLMDEMARTLGDMKSREAAQLVARIKDLEARLESTRVASRKYGDTVARLQATANDRGTELQDLEEEIDLYGRLTNVYLSTQDEDGGQLSAGYHCTFEPTWAPRVGCGFSLTRKVVGDKSSDTLVYSAQKIDKKKVPKGFRQDMKFKRDALSAFFHQMLEAAQQEKK
ncbi:hypothetical protein AURDEDRAFT_176745 [Auricularia subglabra TFB-10046 SS5]|uniref:Uncharacterized protein n=1 Tax=Auricularia subglabra (strain TFB-10046 / SS5) TaxID=717982 RepID=J0WQM4_AURST|nr:hypothetical protein AURDEDRAFT_176745 [Auricularia subglabra TFB-10046 SS5]